LFTNNLKNQNHIVETPFFSPLKSAWRDRTNKFTFFKSSGYKTAIFLLSPPSVGGDRTNKFIFSKNSGYKTAIFLLFHPAFGGGEKYYQLPPYQRWGETARTNLFFPKNSGYKTAISPPPSAGGKNIINFHPTNGRERPHEQIYFFPKTAAIMAFLLC
jgi:hypothetical protein